MLHLLVIIPSSLAPNARVRSIALLITGAVSLAGWYTVYTTAQAAVASGPLREMFGSPELIGVWDPDAARLAPGIWWFLASALLAILASLLNAVGSPIQLLLVASTILIAGGYCAAGARAGAPVRSSVTVAEPQLTGDNGSASFVDAEITIKNPSAQPLVLVSAIGPKAADQEQNGLPGVWARNWGRPDLIISLDRPAEEGSNPAPEIRFGDNRWGCVVPAHGSAAVQIRFTPVWSGAERESAAGQWTATLLDAHQQSIERHSVLVTAITHPSDVSRQELSRQLRTLEQEVLAANTKALTLARAATTNDPNKLTMQLQQVLELVAIANDADTKAKTAIQAAGQDEALKDTASTYSSATPLSDELTQALPECLEDLTHSRFDSALTKLTTIYEIPDAQLTSLGNKARSILGEIAYQTFLKANALTERGNLLRGMPSDILDQAPGRRSDAARLLAKNAVRSLSSAGYNLLSERKPDLPVEGLTNDLLAAFQWEPELETIGENQFALLLLKDLKGGVEKRDVRLFVTQNPGLRSVELNCWLGWENLSREDHAAAETHFQAAENVGSANATQAKLIDLGRAICAVAAQPPRDYASRAKALSTLRKCYLSQTSWSRHVRETVPETAHRIYDSRVISSPDSLWEAMAARDFTRIIWVQLPKDQMPEKEFELLKSWTRDGGVLWLDNLLARADMDDEEFGFRLRSTGGVRDGQVKIAQCYGDLDVFRPLQGNLSIRLAPNPHAVSDYQQRTRRGNDNFAWPTEQQRS